MEGLEATSFACKTLFGWRFSTKPPRRRRLFPLRRVVVGVKGEMDGRDYSGRLVDENMIVLRMRIRDMKISETSHVLPPDWTEWEKKYYAHYNEDVCEAVGLLQSLLMNTRPSLAIGITALVALSVPISGFVVLFQAVGWLRGFYLGFI